MSFIPLPKRPFCISNMVPSMMNLLKYATSTSFWCIAVDQRWSIIQGLTTNIKIMFKWQCHHQFEKWCDITVPSSFFWEHMVQMQFELLYHMIFDISNIVHGIGLYDRNHDRWLKARNVNIELFLQYESCVSRSQIHFHQVRKGVLASRSALTFNKADLYFESWSEYKEQSEVFLCNLEIDQTFILKRKWKDTKKNLSLVSWTVYSPLLTILDQFEPRLTSEDTVQTTSLHRFNQFLHKFWKWVLLWSKKNSS